MSITPSHERDRLVERQPPAPLHELVEVDQRSGTLAHPAQALGLLGLRRAERAELLLERAAEHRCLLGRAALQRDLGADPERVEHALAVPEPLRGVERSVKVAGCGVQVTEGRLEARHVEVRDRDAVVVADPLLELERLERRVACLLRLTEPLVRGREVGEHDADPVEVVGLAELCESRLVQRHGASHVSLGRVARTELAERARDLPRHAELLENRKRRAPELARPPVVTACEGHHARLAERPRPQGGLDPVGQLDCRLQATATLLDVPANAPEVPQRVREAELPRRRRPSIVHMSEPRDSCRGPSRRARARRRRCSGASTRPRPRPRAGTSRGGGRVRRPRRRTSREAPPRTRAPSRAS